MPFRPAGFFCRVSARQASGLNMSNTILIIEDDANTAALITLYCEREGFHTLTAADGRSGLDMASALTVIGSSNSR